MPITKSTKPTWFDSKGVMHTTIEEAQAAEMLEVLKVTNGSADVPDDTLVRLAGDLVANQRDALLAILTTGPTSRPGARKRGGTTNPKRAARKALTPEQAMAAFKKMRVAVDEVSADAEGRTGAPNPDYVPA